MLGIAGRHRVLDVIPVGPRDRGSGLDLDRARLELEELNVDCRNRRGRRDQRPTTTASPLPAPITSRAPIACALLTESYG